MKKTVGIGLVVTLLAVVAIAATTYRIGGTSTGTSISVTNTIGRVHLLHIIAGGTFTNSTGNKIELNNGDGFYVLANPTCTNTIERHLYGDMAWERLGVIRFTLSSDGSTTNFYNIEYMDKK